MVHGLNGSRELPAPDVEHDPRGVRVAASEKVAHYTVLIFIAAEVIEDAGAYDAKESLSTSAHAGAMVTSTASNEGVKRNHAATDEEEASSTAVADSCS